ncbi:hypothetical protein DRN58_06940 [Thermococci archaeon]|nr:MAG: hypothetical protein DRN58_06940 [Thermococci archaeon]
MIEVKIWDGSIDKRKIVSVYIPDKFLKAYYMVGRIVYLYELDEWVKEICKECQNFKCCDCGYQARYIVIDPKVGINWTWCGRCNIGA